VILKPLLLIPVAGIVSVLLFARLQGPLSVPLQSDAAHFQNLAQRMVQGDGYSLDAAYTFWPDSPSMQRMPLWPLVQLPLQLVFPETWLPAAVRCLCGLLHGVFSLLIAQITLRLFDHRLAALFSGLLCAVHPYLIEIASKGLSEPLFLALVAGGMLLLIDAQGQGSGGKGQESVGGSQGTVQGLTLRGCRPGAVVYLAAFLLGLACLVRANFILFPVFLGFAVFSLRSSVSCLRSAVCSLRSAVFPRLLALLLFYLPISVWVVRNAFVGGDFPVISTLRGQTFYGGNNPVVANRLDDWGYWVFPNAVEGEIPLSELSKTMGELDVDRYYMRKGMAYISGHFFEMPRLLLGKLIRAYVPLPWKPGVLPYAAGLYRLMVNLLGLIGVCLMWRRCPRWLPLAAALLLTNIATVLVFWGCGRFAMETEPLVLLPFAGGLLGGRIHGCKTQG